MLFTIIVALVLIAVVAAGMGAYYSPRFVGWLAHKTPGAVRCVILNFEDHHRCDLCFRLKRLHAVEDGYGVWILSLCVSCDPRSCTFCGLPLTKDYAGYETADERPMRVCIRPSCRLQERSYVGPCNGCGDTYATVRQGANRKYALCAHCAPSEPFVRGARISAIGVVDGFRAWYAARDSFVNRPLVEHIAYRVASERIRLALLRFSHFHICPTCRQIRKTIHDVEDSRGNCVMRACEKCHPTGKRRSKGSGDRAGLGGAGTAADASVDYLAV